MSAPFESPSLPAVHRTAAHSTLAADPQTSSAKTRHNSKDPKTASPIQLAYFTATLQSTWQRACGRLAESIAPAFYEKFIAPLNAVGIDSSQDLCLIAHDAKLQRHIEQRYLPLIREAVLSEHEAATSKHKVEAAGQTAIVGVRILSPDSLASAGLPGLHEVPAQGTRAYDSAHASDQPLRAVIAQGQASMVPGTQAISRSHRLNPHGATAAPEHCAHVLEFSLPGHEAAAVNRAELDRLWQGAAFASGCLSLIGPSGSGKTAIAKAYAAHISRQGETVRYLTAEEFLTEFSLACRKRENIAWRETLRAHRVLIIDDFQFIKPQAARSQEELQYLIDAFQSSGRLLILCSDRDAVAQGLSAALASRLQAGDRILLAYPEQSERETIVEQALSAEAATRPGSSLELREEHIRYLAARIQRDMRHLKSAVRRLIQAQSLRVNGQHDWNTNAVDQLCGDLYTRRPTVAPEAVRQAVAEFCQVDEAEITGPRRDRRFTRARHLTAYLCVEYLQLSQKETAAVIGRREHGSVVHARKKIEELLAEDLFLRRQVQDLAESIFSS